MSTYHDDGLRPANALNTPQKACNKQRTHHGRKSSVLQNKQLQRSHGRHRCISDSEKKSTLISGTQRHDGAGPSVQNKMHYSFDRRQLFWYQAFHKKLIGGCACVCRLGNVCDGQWGQL